MTSLFLAALLALQGPPCWGARQTFPGTSSQYLGSSLALSGDRLLVSNASTGEGALVYLRGSSGWALEQELTGSAGTAGNVQRVALDGDLALVSDPYHDEAGALVGNVLVFRRGAAGWTAEAELLPPPQQQCAYFGASIATSEGRIAIGAPGTRDVHVFEQLASGWSETHLIPAPAPGCFGHQVALEGDLLAVGGGEHDSGTPDDAVHLFRWDGLGWAPEASLPTPTTDVAFPSGLALSQGRLAAGAPSTDYGDPDADRVLVYERRAGTWTGVADLRPPPAGGRFVDFGNSVALDGTRLAVGAPAAQASPDLARVVLYDGSSGVWSELATLTPSSAPPSTLTDRFGQDVALQGSTLATADPLRALYRGEVWVFEEDPLLAPAVGYRGAPGNPVSYAATEPRLGEALRLTVAPALSGHAQALVFGFDSPGSLVLGGGQTLLCLDLGGNGQLLDTGFAPGPIATFVLAVPTRAELLGATLCTQALHAFGTPGFVLSNAQDLRIGAPSGACP